MNILIVTLGVLLTIAGAAAVYVGYPIVEVERGWTGVIAGTTALTGGVLTIALGLVLGSLGRLRRTIEAARAPLGLPLEVPVGPAMVERAAPPPPPPPLSLSPAVAAAPFAAVEPPGALHDVQEPTVVDPSILGRQTDRDRYAEDERHAEAARHAEAERYAEAERQAEIEQHAEAERQAETERHAEAERQAEAERYAEIERQAEAERYAEIERHEEAERRAHVASSAHEDAHDDAATVPPSIDDMWRRVDEELAQADWSKAIVPAAPHAELAHEPHGEPALSAEHEPPPAAPPLVQHREEHPPAVPEPVADHGGTSPFVAVHPPSVPAAEPAPVVPQPGELVVIGRYQADDTAYTMFADGSIEAASPTGVYRFASMAELKAFIDSEKD